MIYGGDLECPMANIVNKFQTSLFFKAIPPSENAAGASNRFQPNGSGRNNYYLSLLAQLESVQLTVEFYCLLMPLSTHSVLKGFDSICL